MTSLWVRPRTTGPVRYSASGPRPSVSGRAMVVVPQVLASNVVRTVAVAGPPGTAANQPIGPVSRPGWATSAISTPSVPVTVVSRSAVVLPNDVWSTRVVARGVALPSSGLVASRAAIQPMASGAARATTSGRPVAMPTPAARTTTAGARYQAAVRRQAPARRAPIGAGRGRPGSVIPPGAPRSARRAAPSPTRAVAIPRNPPRSIPRTPAASAPGDAARRPGRPV